MRRSEEVKRPTFSSILLDEIYRSMAEDHVDRPQLKKDAGSFRGDHHMPKEKVVSGEEKRRAFTVERESSGSSSCSDTSSSGVSSQDNDSFRGARASPADAYGLGKPPKPIRTGPPRRMDTGQALSENQHLSEEGLIKSKFSALKIYSNLKKMKQPISPGGRLTTFIHSLFQPGNARKPPPETPRFVHRKPRAPHLTKDSLATGANRTVPVEDAKPGRQKIFISPEEMTSWEFLNKYRYQNAKVIHVESRKRGNVAWDDEDCDAMSCESSDLFELDHLTSRDELRVYETTCFGSKRFVPTNKRV